MILIAGYGRRAKALGEGPTIDCPNCGNTVPTIVFETSKRATLMFIPVATWKKEYWLVCPVCERGAALRSRQHAQRVVAERLSGHGAPELASGQFERLDG